MKRLQILEDNRIIWVDMVKGYAMLFVMLHHIAQKIHVPIYSLFYAPFFLTSFFVVSGYTFSSKRSFDKFFFRKIKTLLVPLFCLGFLCILMSYIFSFHEPLDLKQEILDLVIQKGRSGHKLWFIAAMFLSSCIFYPISKLKKSIYCLVCCLLIIINIIVKQFFCIGSCPWHIDVIGFACFWMGLGYYLKTYVSDTSLNKFLKNKRTLLFIFILYFISLIFCFFVLDVSYIEFSGPTSNPIVYFILNGLGVTLIILFCNHNHVKLVGKFLVFIGQNTLFYFAFHGKIESVLLFIINRINADSFIISYSYAAVPFVTIIEAFILVVPCICFKLFFPFVVGKDYMRKKEDRSENLLS